MKIYEIGTGYTPIPAQMGAATEIVVEELTKAFQKLNIPVEIVDIKTADRKKNDLPIQEVWVPGCFSGTDVKLGILHKLKRVVYSVCLTRKLKGLLRKAEEKVVLHFHNQYNLFFFLKLTSQKLRKRALIAYTNHSGVWRQEWASIETTIRKRYFQEAECMRQADVVFVLNEETVHNAVNHIGAKRERFCVIQNGVNTGIYYPLPIAEKEKIKEKYGLSGKTVILQVGSVNENKGQLRALKLLMPLMKNNPELVYAYIGGIVSPDYQKQIEAYAEQNKLKAQVRYLGIAAPGAELNEIYNMARSMIFPSIYEAFGMVIIEAMAAGIPVLISNDSPFSMGEGCLGYDKENFSEAVNCVLSEKGKAISGAARENAVAKYSWEKIAMAYGRKLVTEEAGLE